MKVGFFFLPVKIFLSFYFKTASSMKIATFSTQNYDKQYLDEFNTGHEITYFEVPLNEQTVALTNGFDAVCIFVNDQANEIVLKILAANGIKLIVLRCAGFNNVDIKTADQLGIPVVRVPA